MWRREPERMRGEQCDTSGRTTGTPARNPSVEDVGSAFESILQPHTVQLIILFIYLQKDGVTKSFLLSFVIIPIFPASKLSLRGRSVQCHETSE